MHTQMVSYNLKMEGVVIKSVNNQMILSIFQENCKKMKKLKVRI